MQKPAANPKRDGENPEPMTDAAAVAAAEEPTPAAEGTEALLEAEAPEQERPDARWDAVLQLTAEEIRACLQHADRRRMGTWRICLYAVLLGVVSVSSLVSFFVGGGQNGMTLFLGIGGLALLLLVVLYEPVSLRQMVKREAAAGKKLHLWVFDDCLGFGESETFETYSFSEFYCKKFPDLLILHFARGLLVAIPRRAVPADCWEFLSTRLPEDTPQTKRR